MAECGDYVISPWESEIFIENMKFTTLEEVGTDSWLEFHKKLILLNQQSILEVTTMQEEAIKELLIIHQKIPNLVYEAIQINVWKKKVFPFLIELNENPNNSFLLYSVFYHEELAVSLLENVLFHSESVASMEDAVIDLVDYAVDNVTALLYSKHKNSLQSSHSCLEELMRKKTEFEIDIQFKCISILRYLAEFIDELPLSAVSRMLCTHDVPYFLAQLIETKPWIKTENDETFVYNGKWQKIVKNDDKIPKIEAQVWLGLREFLLNPKCASYYEITRFRQSQFLKLQKYLQEKVLDQISPLIDLRRWLSYLNINQQVSNTQRPVIVEVVPEMKLSILEKYNKRWKRLAKHQSKILFNNDIENIKTKAQILSNAYNFDNLEIISGKSCFYCNDVAKKRCSKCKSAWYCKRECQVKDWKNHKDICLKLESN